MTKTALIVEDEVFVALDLERILTDAGYRVAAIADSRNSAMAAAGDCDLAFVDVNLRDGRTGPQIASELVRDHGMKVVFVTANPEQIDCDCDCGSRFVRKPFNDRAILDAAAAIDTGATITPVIKA